MTVFREARVPFVSQQNVLITFKRDTKFPPCLEHAHAVHKVYVRRKALQIARRSHLRLRQHYDSGFGMRETRDPSTGCSNKLPALVFLRVLSKEPDVSSI